MGIIVDPGSAQRIEVLDGESIIIQTRQSAVLRCISGMGIPSGEVVATVCKASFTFGPYPRGVYSVTAIGDTATVINSAAPAAISQIQLKDVLQSPMPSSRYKSSAMLRFNSAINLTPTQFFDPSAARTAATGTFENPFNTLAQVETYYNSTLSGLAFGKVLGWKRGTTVRGKLELLVTGFGNSGRLSDNPFMIIPYGDAEGAPKIIGAIQVGGNAQQQWVYDGVFWFYDTGSTRQADAFQDGQRIYKRANRASALAAGAGFSYWSGTRIYVLPYQNAFDLNSTATMVEVQSAFGAVATNIGHVVLARYRNQARTGNIIIAGIESNKAINSGFSIQSASTFDQMTYVDTLQIIGCVSRDAGADQTAIAAGSDGFVITGPSDTVRASNVYAGGNYAENCLNNSVEVNGVNGGIIEWNTSTGCGGNSIAELFASCSNVRTQYNFGVGAGDYPAFTAGSFAGGGYWVSGYVWDQINGGTGNTDVTKNINNDVYFNVALNSRNIALSYDAGTGGKIANNVWHSVGVIVGSPNGAPTVQIGTNPNMLLTSSVEWSNNIVINGGQDNVTLRAGLTSGAVRNLVMTGDNNFYWNTASGYGQNTTISTVNNNGATVAASNLTYTNIESWTAGFAAGGNTIDSNGRMNDPKIDLSTGRPQFGSPLLGRRPAMPSGYYSDLAATPILTSFVGAYQG